jgi:H+/Cl- antiporter ClcA
LIFGIIGVLMGIVAFIVDLLVEFLVIWKWQMTQSVMTASGVGAAWLVFLTVSVAFAATAAGLTIYVGPGAMGSGIAELMGYFNGVHIP